MSVAFAGSLLRAVALVAKCPGMIVLSVESLLICFVRAVDSFDSG
jgi:hypothetical protein